MKEELKSMWWEFVNWLKYVRDYKENKDYCEIKEAEVLNAYKEMEDLKDKIKELKITSKVKDELLEKKDNRIEILNMRISELMKDNNNLSGKEKRIKKGIKKLEVK